MSHHRSPNKFDTSLSAWPQINAISTPTSVRDFMGANKTGMFSPPCAPQRFFSPNYMHQSSRFAEREDNIRASH